MKIKRGLMVLLLLPAGLSACSSADEGCALPTDSVSSFSLSEGRAASKELDAVAGDRLRINGVIYTLPSSLPAPGPDGRYSARLTMTGNQVVMEMEDDMFGLNGPVACY